MKKSSAFLSAISVLALAGGLTPGAIAQMIYTVPEICFANVSTCCNVKVTVEGTNVAIDPATVTVTGRESPVVIVWYLATPGYKFASPSPLAIPTDPALNRYQFMPNDDRFCYWWRSGTVYVCHDYNYATLDMNYTVKVDAMSGSSLPPANGRIVNN